MSRFIAKSMLAFFCTLTTGVVYGADSADTHKIAEQVAQDVRDLGDKTPGKADIAEIHLLADGADEYPAIEAAASHPGLPPDVAAKLNHIIAIMKPMQAARLKIAAAKAALIDWRIKDALAAYDTAGQKNPKWDAAVKDAFTAYFHDDGASEATRAMVQKAVALGCVDPYLLDIAANCANMLPTPDRVASDKYWKVASVAIQSSNYPPHIKFAVDIDYASQLREHGEPIANRPDLPPLPPDAGVNPMVMGPKVKGTATSLYHKAAAIWPRIVKEPGIPSKALEELAMNYIAFVNYPKHVDQPVFDQIVPPLKEATPNTLASLNLEGHLEYLIAWHERGPAVAAKVPPAQMQSYMDHLAKAEALLAKSAKMFPEDSESSTFMIPIMLEGHGQQSRKTIDDWFKHAIAINPDDSAAYRELLRTELPQWGGTATDLTGFMQLCVLSMNYHAGIPFIATEVFDQIGHMNDRIWRDAKTWETIDKLYTPWLEAKPDDNVARSRYTYLACKCSQWKIAKAQFALLGDKVVESQFESKSLFMWRQQVNTH